MWWEPVERPWLIASGSTTHFRIVAQGIWSLSALVDPQLSIPRSSSASQRDTGTIWNRLEQLRLAAASFADLFLRSHESNCGQGWLPLGPQGHSGCSCHRTGIALSHRLPSSHQAIDELVSPQQRESQMMWSQAAEGSCLPSLVLCVKPSAFRPSNCPFPHISLLPTVFPSSFILLFFLLDPSSLSLSSTFAIQRSSTTACTKLRVPPKFHRRHRSSDSLLLSQSRPIIQHPNITVSL